jgi:hypothetical protein
MNLAMDSGPSSSWQYQQRAIDAEIKSLEVSLRALRQRRNTLSPISSLPAEVIAGIFLLRVYLISGLTARPGLKAPGSARLFGSHGPVFSRLEPDPGA